MRVCRKRNRSLPCCNFAVHTYTVKMIQPQPPNTNSYVDGTKFKRPRNAQHAGICLEAVSEQGVLQCRLDSGMMEQACAHAFCFTCVITWAKRTNTCPMCKARFNAVHRAPQQTARGIGETVEVRRQRQGCSQAGCYDLKNETREGINPTWCLASSSQVCRFSGRQKTHVHPLTTRPIEQQLEHPLLHNT